MDAGYDADFNAVYIPPHKPACESYWFALLEQGPFSRGLLPGSWEWLDERSEDPPTVWEEAQRLHDAHEVLTLTVDGYNRGGLIITWQGVECFVPASHLVDYPFPADPEAREKRFEKYVGAELRLCIIEVEPARKRILLSERRVEDCEGQRVEWPDWLCEGAVCEGEITSVRPFGAFVDIGPLEGMIHISEISWGRVRHPRDFVSPGETVKVMVLNVDPENQRVGLSIKQLTENPWDCVEDHLSCGQELKGTVAGVERFGVFVELWDGLEGLLHVSEISGEDNSDGGLNLYRAYEVGQPINVRILDIVPGEHRIALGLADGVGTYGPQG
ncbi:MAG: S1 RNA-binding domain-containing protein [Anaerolineae bacterium]